MVAADVVVGDVDSEGESACVGGDGGDESFGFEEGWVDAAGEGAHFVDGAVGVLGDGVEGCDGCWCGVAFGDLSGDPEFDFDGDELLLGAVVEVPLESASGVVLDRHDAPTRGAEFVDASLEVVGQALVAQCQAHPGGDLVGETFIIG